MTFTVNTVAPESRTANFSVPYNLTKRVYLNDTDLTALNGDGLLRSGGAAVGNDEEFGFYGVAQAQGFGSPSQVGRCRSTLRV